MIHYIVAVFIGVRANEKINSLLEVDPTYLVKKHMFALSTLQIPKIKRVTFVVSPSDDRQRDNAVVDFVRSQTLAGGIEIDSYVKEDNRFFSYGSWNDAMVRNINDDNHFFLIEDDYFPCMDDFYDPFLEVMEDASSPYVPQMWTNKFTRKHVAAISNGLMNINDARWHYENYGECIWLKGIDPSILNGSNQGVIAQIHFLDGYTKAGREISDVSDEYAHPFLSPENRVFIYGTRKKGIPIKCESYGEVKHEEATYNRVKLKKEP